MATFTQLCNRIEELGLRVPYEGTGKNGKILNRDLEAVIAEHYREQREITFGRVMRDQLHDVQLAYRYDQLKQDEQEAVISDGNGWVAEEKFDGCRMVLVYHPDEGFSAFGRNRSTVTLLPVEYTEKLLVPLNGKLSTLKEFAGHWKEEFILDCELVTDGFVELNDGNFTGKGLNAVTSMLQLNVHDSHLAQRTTAPMELVAFDFLPIEHEKIITEIPFKERLELMQGIPMLDRSVRLPKQWERGKKTYFESLVANGEEGVVLKNLSSFYIPAIGNFRGKNSTIKLKRSMSMASQTDIDAFVTGYTNGGEWDKAGLIAGITLGVYLLGDNNEQLGVHWLATVSGIPLQTRMALSEVRDGKPALKTEFYGQVLTIDGQDISARNQRISHAKADWVTGFRHDKTAYECTMRRSFIESQMF